MKIETHSCDGSCLLCKMGVPRVSAATTSTVRVPSSMEINGVVHCMRGECPGEVGPCVCPCAKCTHARSGKWR